MFDIIYCIAYEHDIRLVALALTTCIFSALVGIKTMSRAHKETGWARTAWAYAASFALGFGIWSTHFIAMVAYAPGPAVQLALVPTLSSAAIGTIVIGAGVRLLLSGAASRLRIIACAAMALTGVGGLHYVGMLGMVMPATLEWDAIKVVASLLASFPLFIGAFAAMAGGRSKPSIAIATSCFTLAVVLLHFTGMDAVTVIQGFLPADVPLIPREAVTAMATGSMVAIVALGIGAFVFDRSLSERDAAQQVRVSYLAEHDVLTGLINREQLSRELDTILSGEPQDRIAVHFIDLDRFKEINDHHGHGVGDKILVEAASRLRTTCRKGDLIARIGGDEMIVVQMDVDRSQARINADRMVEALSKPTSIDDSEFVIGASIGIAVYPDDGMTRDELMRNADIALYKAKDLGRGQSALFDDELAQKQRDRWMLQRDLRMAVERNEMSVVYQPQVRTADNAIIGFEVLVRWTHPTRGNVPPSDFIALAEEIGAIGDIGEFVLRQACRDASSWKNQETVSVNLSPLQISRGDIVSLVQQVLTETGLAAERLELEVTEGVLMRDTDRSLEVLNALKAMGVRIAMDDFGTGYSSLSYLQTFAFDKIKIDRSFVMNLETNEQSRAIVRTVCSLGRGLGVPITAEGVETAAQLSFLLGEDCDSVQGYFTGRPLPIAAYFEPTVRVEPDKDAA